LWLRRRQTLWLFALCAPLGFIAIEAGWTVTEVGRQPWIIYGVMRTKDAVTPMPGLIYPMMLFTGVYLLLAFVVTWLMVRQFRHVG
jgi:cytochrome d ubiquinol oxidase subunit I